MAIYTKDPTEVRKQVDYNPSDFHAKCIKMVYDRKDAMNKSRLPWVAEWEAAEARVLPQFLNSSDSPSSIYVDPDDQAKFNESEGWSALRIPMAHQTIQAFLAEMSARSPEAIVIPWRQRGEPIAKIIQQCVKFTWTKGDGDMELMKLLADKFTYGTSVALELLVSDLRKIKDIVSYDPTTGKVEYEEKMIRDFDDPKMQWISLWDVWFDDMVKEPAIEKCADFMYRKVYTLDRYKKLRAKFPNVKYVLGTGDHNSMDSRFDFYKPEKYYDNEIVEELHYYNRDEDQYIIVANDVLMSESPNPYIHKELPVAIDRDIVDNHAFYGRGEPHLLEDITQEMEAIRNMRLDNMYVGIHKSFFFDETLSIDEDDMWLAPGRGIPVKNNAGERLTDLIYPMEFNDVKASAYNEEDRLVSDAVRTTGIDPNLSNGQPGATATDVAMQRETAMKRVAIKLKYTERVFLKRIFRLRVQNIQQFYSEKRVKKLTAPDDMQEVVQLVADIKKFEMSGEQDQHQMAVQEFHDKYSVDPENGDVYAYNPREIYVENDDGGYSFFQIDPDRIRQNVDVDVVQGAQLPVSKNIEQEKYKDYVVTMTTQFPEIVNRRYLAKQYAKKFDDSPSEVLLPEKPPVPEQPKISLSINFKDLPPDGQAQLAAMAQIQLDKGQMIATDAATKAEGAATDIAKQVQSGQIPSQLPSNAPAINQNEVTPGTAGGALATSIQNGIINQ